MGIGGYWVNRVVVRPNGAESLTFGGAQSGAAKVNDREISFNELQFAIEQQRRQLSEIYGDQWIQACLMTTC